MTRIVFEIRVQGAVPPRLLDDFDGITLAVDPVGTTMRARLTDEAELHGVLDALRRAGLVLVDVRREHASGQPVDPAP